MSSFACVRMLFHPFGHIRAGLPALRHLHHALPPWCGWDSQPLRPLGLANSKIEARSGRPVAWAVFYDLSRRVKRPVGVENSLKTDWKRVENRLNALFFTGFPFRTWPFPSLWLGAYERAMYQEVEESVNGFLRGTKGFNADGFASLSLQEQYRVCNIPLSQPLFTGAPQQSLSWEEGS